MVELRTPIKHHTRVNMGGYQGKIKYIVIHFVGARGQAWDNAKYFRDVYREASAHYFIDQKTTIEVVPENRAAWHVGDGLGKYGITNYNSIGIEGCQDVTTGPNVWHWDFHSDTYMQMLLLTKHLMAKYNVPIQNVVRHYDASRKMCPGNWQWNNWAKWHKFKKDLAMMTKGGDITKSPDKSNDKVSESKGSQGTMYTIQVGETLSKIAKAHGATVNDLVKWNKIKNPDLIFPETKIIVKPAENKAGIKRQGQFRFNTTVNVRNQAGAHGPVPAKYYRGEVVSYSDVIEKDNMLWLQYKSWTGSTQYVSAGTKVEPYGTFI